MALNKVTYSNADETIINDENLNDIQDEIIANAEAIAANAEAIEHKASSTTVNEIEARVTEAEDSITALNENTVKKASTHEMLTSASNFNALEDGIYSVNTWGGSGGTGVPTSKGMGFMIQQTAANGSTNAQLMVCNNGVVLAKGKQSDEWHELALKSDIGTKSQSLTNSTYLNGNAVVRRFGKVCTLEYSGDAKKVDSNSWVTLFNLPQEYRPVNIIYFPIRSITALCWGYIASNGDVKYYSPTASAGISNFQFSVSWLTV